MQPLKIYCSFGAAPPPPRCRLPRIDFKILLGVLSFGVLKLSRFSFTICRGYFPGCVLCVRRKTPFRQFKKPFLGFLYPIKPGVCIQPLHGFSSYHLNLYLQVPQHLLTLQFLSRAPSPCLNPLLGVTPQRAAPILTGLRFMTIPLNADAKPSGACRYVPAVTLKGWGR